jgi:hypothetical protein
VWFWFSFVVEKSAQTEVCATRREPAVRLNSRQKGLFEISPGPEPRRGVKSAASLS